MFDNHIRDLIRRGFVSTWRDAALSMSAWLTDYYLERPQMYFVGENPPRYTPRKAGGILRGKAATIAQLAETDDEIAAAERLLSTLATVFAYALEADREAEACERLFACYGALCEMVFKTYEAAKDADMRDSAIAACQFVAHMPRTVWPASWL